MSFEQREFVPRLSHDDRLGEIFAAEIRLLDIDDGSAFEPRWMRADGVNARLG